VFFFYLVVIRHKRSLGKQSSFDKMKLSKRSFSATEFQRRLTLMAKQGRFHIGRFHKSDIMMSLYTYDHII